MAFLHKHRGELILILKHSELNWKCECNNVHWWLHRFLKRIAVHCHITEYSVWWFFRSELFPVVREVLEINGLNPNLAEELNPVAEDPAEYVNEQVSGE